MRHDGANVGLLHAGLRDKAMVDVHNVHAEYLRRRIEREVVERGRNGAFERVFGGDHAVGGLSTIDELEHLGERCAWHELSIGRIKLLRECEGRLVAVRPFGSQIGNRHAFAAHGNSSCFGWQLRHCTRLTDRLPAHRKG